jgi:hypothetical protein
VLPTCPVPSVTDIPGRTTKHEFFRSLFRPYIKLLGMSTASAAAGRSLNGF